MPVDNTLRYPVVDLNPRLSILIDENRERRLSQSESGAKRWTLDFPDLGPGLVPTETCTSRDFFREGAGSDLRFCQEYLRTSGRDTILGDMSTLENVQAGLASGVRRHFILQDGEVLVRHFHKVVAESVQG